MVYHVGTQELQDDIAVLSEKLRFVDKDNVSRLSAQGKRDVKQFSIYTELAELRGKVAEYEQRRCETCALLLGSMTDPWCAWAHRAPTLPVCKWTPKETANG